MTEQGRRKTVERTPDRPSAPALETVHDGDEAERVLGRAVAVGLPILAIVSAVVVGFVASVGSGLLVLASGALLGTIALLWASVRTLSGDAPLPTDLEALAAQNRDVDALAEEKRRVLRALKDIESEHAIGKIDDADYETIAAQYRQQAKALMREMDDNAAPSIAEAERLAREYLAAQGVEATKILDKPTASTPEKASASPYGSSGATAVNGANTATGEPLVRERVLCASCVTSNEPDAAFCKKCGASMKPASAKAVKENDATS